MQKSFEDLIIQAKIVSENAYAPYSNFKVGAAALFETGNIYTGCNVENGSYGLSLCAERNALSTAIAQGEKSKLVAVAIYSPNMSECSPCGACRQWIYEFNNNAVIVLEKQDKSLVVLNIKDLLPNTFKIN